MKKTFPPLTIQLVTLFALLFVVGCGNGKIEEPIQPEQTSSKPTQTVILKTETPIPSPTIANSSTPTITITNTSTSAPTFTNAPEPTLGLVGDGLSGWCIPEGVSLSLLDQKNTPPENAKVGKFTNGEFDINDLPVGACLFRYSFNKTAPEDAILEIYDSNPTSPWLTIKLTPVSEDPQTIAGVATHPYIIAPPFWDISYTLVLKDGSGAEIQRDTLNLHRWKPGKCWNGQYPNINTMRCPLQQDLHPWDIGYNTPIPTLTPGSSD